MKTPSGEHEGLFLKLTSDRVDTDRALGQMLTDLFEIHRAMIGKLVNHDPHLANHVAEFLEDVANRYLDISELIQSRKAIILRD